MFIKVVDKGEKGHITELPKATTTTMSVPSHPLPTPDCIDVSSVTPDSIKSPTPPTLVVPASSSAQDGEANPSTAPASEDRSGSPPPSCPICLGTYKNKCFTDSCLHQFCFNCLLEWSKIKAECPLCKQSFKSIIHNVKSEREFEEYLVQQPLHYNLMLSEPYRFSYSTTLQVRPSQNETLQRLFLHHPSLTDRYIFPRNDRPLVRRRIYERGLYALPLFDITGRARECSAEFYRNNQAQMHRLIPFLNREAIHVIQDQRLVTSLMQRATEILTTHDITSPEFRRQMEPYFREDTVHFIHEFYNFARSPYDIYGYDNNVQYSQDYNLALQTAETSNSEQRDQQRRGTGVGSTAVAGSSRGTATVPNRQMGSATNSVPSWGMQVDPSTVYDVSSSSSSSEDESSRNQPSTSTSSAPTGVVRRTENVSVIQTNPVNLSTPSTSSGVDAPPAIKTEQQRVESVIRTAGEPSVKIELSDTDSDECQFVLERKPPHLRTPEYVSLNSDEDSDVVFVEQSTSAPVLPVKEPPRKSTTGNVPPSNMNLMEDSNHLPMFLPYMVGMDVVEAAAGPSGTSGMAHHSGVVQAEVGQSSSSNGDFKLKNEDPMLSVSSSKKRNRQSLKRQSTGGGATSRMVWTSSDEEEQEQDNAREQVAQNNSRRRRTTQPTNYADSESSEDEYLAMRMMKTSPRKKESPTKGRRKGKGGGRQVRKKNAPVQGNTKRQRRSEELPQLDQHQAGQQVDRLQMHAEERPGSESSTSSSSSEDEEATVNSKTSEGIERHQSTQLLPTPQEVIQSQRPTEQEAHNQQVQLNQQPPSEETSSGSPTEEDEDNDSNQGSVATSESRGTTEGDGDSDSEEIDVQNDDVE